MLNKESSEKREGEEAVSPNRSSIVSFWCIDPRAGVT